MAPKHLDEICWMLAAKVLGKPGTIVEQVKGVDIGRINKVINSKNICLYFEDGTAAYADFFRKVD